MRSEGMKELSILLKEIRIHNKEILKDMADKLDFSSTFLSAIENGKKKVPDNFYNKIISNYNLSEEEKKELEESILVANQKIDIDISDKEVSKQKLAISFARSFDDMDEDMVAMLQEILNKREK